jgi:hypothetical protein
MTFRELLVKVQAECPAKLSRPIHEAVLKLGFLALRQRMA